MLLLICNDTSSELDLRFDSLANFLHIFLSPLQYMQDSSQR